MLSIRNLFVCSLLLARFNTFVAAEPTFDNGNDAEEAAADMAAFQQLLKEVDENALHAALHDYSPTKFKHGVFREDRTALEAVHQENAAVATKLISLAKRANEPNNTTSAEASATSTQIVTVPPSSSAVNPVMPSDRSSERQTPVPMPQSSQPAPSSAPASSAPGSSAPASPPASSAPANSPAQPTTVLITSTRPASTVAASSQAPGSSQEPPAQLSSVTRGSSQGQPSAVAGGVSTATVVATGAGSVITTTDAAGVTIVSTVGGGFVTLTAEAPGSVVTTTDGTGATIISTVGGGFVTLTQASPSDSAASSGGNSGPSSQGASSRSLTSTILHTTTLPDGSQSTVTAITVVPAPYTTAPTPSGTAGVNPAVTTTGQPGLQTGAAAASTGREMVLMLGGAIAVAMMV